MGLLAAAVLFGIGVLVFDARFIIVSSSWDFIVLRMLSLLSSLGLLLILIALVHNLWSMRTTIQKDLHDKTAEELG